MKKKWLWPGLGAAAILIIASVLYIILAKDKQAQQPVMEQSTARVAKGDILVSVSGAGSIISTEEETVRTKDEGVVAEVKVKEGDVVQKGQTLLTFEDNDLSGSIAAKESSLENEQLNLEELQDKYKREVYDGGTEESLASIKLSITKQEKNIQTIKDEIASLKEDMIAPDPLTAPIDGTITAVHISSGERAKEGNELFTLIDYQALSATVSIDELDIPKVQTDMRAEVKLDAIPNQTFAGVVTGIANEGKASGGVSLFDVTVKLDKSEGIRAGMSAEVTIILEEKTDVLTLPIEAVQKVGEDDMVILPSAGKTASSLEAPASTGRSKPNPNVSSPEPEQQEQQGPQGQQGQQRQQAQQGSSGNPAGGLMQKVEVGVHDETRIEIVSGLQEGDEVVIPTVRRSASSNNQAGQQMMPGGSMPGAGFGGMGGGTGGVIPGGGASGGGGAMRRSGGGFQ
ncbi:efflux RND transporter periplasmic adaptor subunit [Paenibacillus woosongensis]|nr:efflux RND transporter periplasmic adaptor subunit [Paenibacillus woosongensis]